VLAGLQDKLRGNLFTAWAEDRCNIRQGVKHPKL
jgi:hypothetical protein